MTDFLNIKHITADSSEYTLEGWVRTDADFGARFAMVEDDGTCIKVNGWLFDVEVSAT